MPPNEQQKPDNSSYDFILAAEEPKPGSLWSRINKKKLIFGLILLTIFATVFLSVLYKLNTEANNVQRQKLLAVAQSQTEIKRIAQIGADKAASQQTQSRAEAISKSIETSLQQNKEFMIARGLNPDETTLNSKKNTQLDEQLKKAETYQNYDKTLNSILDKLFIEYQRDILAAMDGANATEEGKLQADYKEADSILGLVDQI